MAIEVPMPQMGADMTEGTLVRWVKQVGDEVQRGEVLAEIETDKATVELEAFESGHLLKQAVGEGEVVPVGQVIAVLGEPGEEVADVERKPPAATPARRTVEPEARPTPVATGASAQPQPAEPSSLQSAETAPAPAPPPQRRGVPVTVGAAPGGHEGNGRLHISPVARRIASEAGLDVHGLKGSGPDGRILRRDVEEALAREQQPTDAPVPQPPAGPARGTVPAPGVAPAGRVEGLSRMRQAIARRMTQAKQTQPHYYLTLDIDMTEALRFREQLNSAATEQQHVSINDLVVKACAIALERHPKFNAEFGDNGLRFHDRININVAVALDEGLIAPAVLDCGSKSLGKIAEDAKSLAERAKHGGLTADELSAGTFTITNLGAYGVETLIGIINPPQAAILGVGSVMDRPVVRDRQVVARRVMKIALSADHRVTDGAEGARFIKEIQSFLENPVSLAL